MIALILLSFTIIPAAADDNTKNTVPVPELPVYVLPFGLFAVLGASVWLLRKTNLNTPVLMKLYKPVAFIVMVVLLVPFAVANTATGSVNAAPSTASLVVVSAVMALTTLTGFTSLWILLTGKKRLAGLLRIHLSLAKLTGHVVDIYNLVIDPFAGVSESGLSAAFVGNGFNLGSHYGTKCNWIFGY